MSEGATPIYILREGSTRNRGHDAQRNNIMAAKIVTETIRTTLGPLGMDKMLVSGMGDIVISSDGATIMKEFDIQHPAAKMLVEVARSQDKGICWRTAGGRYASGNGHDVIRLLSRTRNSHIRFRCERNDI